MIIFRAVFTGVLVGLVTRLIDWVFSPLRLK